MADFDVSAPSPFPGFPSDLLASAYSGNYLQMQIGTPAPSSDFSFFQSCMPMTPFTAASQQHLPHYTEHEHDHDHAALLPPSQHQFPLEQEHQDAEHTIEPIEPLAAVASTPIPDELVHTLELQELERELARQDARTAAEQERRRLEDDLRAQLAACMAENADTRTSLADARHAIDHAHTRRIAAMAVMQECADAIEEAARFIDRSNAAQADATRRANAILCQLSSLHGADLGALTAIADAAVAARPYSSLSSPAAMASPAWAPVSSAIAAFHPGAPPAQPTRRPNQKNIGAPPSPVLDSPRPSPQTVRSAFVPVRTPLPQFAGKRPAALDAPVPPHKQNTPAPAPGPPKRSHTKRVPGATTPAQAPIVRPRPLPLATPKYVPAPAPPPAVVVAEGPEFSPQQQEPADADTWWFGRLATDTRAAKALQAWTEQHAIVFYFLSARYEQTTLAMRVDEAETWSTAWLRNSVGGMAATSSHIALHLPEGVRAVEYWPAVCTVLHAIPAEVWGRVQLCVEAQCLNVDKDEVFKRLKGISRLRLVNTEGHKHWGCAALLLGLEDLQTLTLTDRIPPSGTMPSSGGLRIDSFAELPLLRLRRIVMHEDVDQQDDASPGAWTTYCALSKGLRRTARERGNPNRPPLLVVLPHSDYPHFVQSVADELYAVAFDDAGNATNRNSILFRPSDGAQAVAIAKALLRTIQRLKPGSCPEQADAMRTALSLLEIPDGDDAMAFEQMPIQIPKLLAARYS